MTASSAVGSATTSLSLSRSTTFSIGSRSEIVSVFCAKSTFSGTKRLGASALPSHFKKPRTRYRSVSPKSSILLRRIAVMESIAVIFCWAVQFAETWKKDSSGRGPLACSHFSKNRSPASMRRGDWKSFFAEKLSRRSLESKRAASCLIWATTVDGAMADDDIP